MPGYVSASVAVAGRRPHSGCSLGRAGGDRLAAMLSATWRNVNVLSVGGLILPGRGKLIGHLLCKLPGAMADETTTRDTRSKY